MAYYSVLRKIKDEKHQHHIADRLLALRRALREQVSENPKAGEFKIATWNLMHFGGAGSYCRTKESLMYIAEIIDHFDMVCVQEVKRDLRQLKELIKYHLGDDWEYIVSDTTEGDKGNDERLAVLYRRGKVTFDRMVGEIVLPVDAAVSDAVEGGMEDEAQQAHRQFARTPYYLNFRARWFKFKLCLVHIHYGAKGGMDKKLRAAEISRLAQFLTRRSDDERAAEIQYATRKGWDTTPSAANYILLGDFNIHKTRDDLSRKALVNNGFEVPEDIDGLATNTGAREEAFDQIAFRLNDQRFSQGAGGVFDYRRLIYRPQDSYFYWQHVKIPKLLKKGEAHQGDPEAVKEYFASYYRKHQISDHLLLWTSFNIDYADDYLTQYLK
ncbi:MAG: hypothetical protein Tsb002_19070 [Wenzhouxiangellaceae bacterium]